MKSIAVGTCSIHAVEAAWCSTSSAGSAPKATTSTRLSSWAPSAFGRLDMRAIRPSITSSTIQPKTDQLHTAEGSFHIATSAIASDVRVTALGGTNACRSSDEVLESDTTVLRHVVHVRCLVRIPMLTLRGVTL